MTHKFCDKCGKRITFDGDNEDCYSYNSKVIVTSYLSDNDNIVHKIELEFCDDCIVEFRRSLYKEDKNEDE